MVWERQCIEDISTKDDRLTQLINFKGVYRTALAKPGLLIMHKGDQSTRIFIKYKFTKSCVPSLSLCPLSPCFPKRQWIEFCSRTPYLAAAVHTSQDSLKTRPADGFSAAPVSRDTGEDSSHRGVRGRHYQPRLLLPQLRQDTWPGEDMEDCPGQD